MDWGKGMKKEEEKVMRREKHSDSEDEGRVGLEEEDDERVDPEENKP